MKTQQINYSHDKELQEVLYKKFLDWIPRRFEEAIEREWDEELKSYAHSLDQVEFFLRQYIVRLEEEKLNEVTKELSKSKKFRMEDVYWIFDSIEGHIMNNELYELMPRYKRGKEKVLKKLERR